jgi:hypothetical protein
MTAPRIIAIILFTLLLGLAGAGYYYYRNLPEIIEARVKHDLQEFGVETFRYDGLRISRQALSSKDLLLRGSYAGIDYTAKLTALQVRYDWRALMLGKIESLSLDTLELEISGLPEADGEESDISIESADIALRSFLDKLPVAAVTVKQWHLNYKDPNDNNILAGGTLSVARQLALTLNTQYQDIEITAQLNTRGDSALPQLHLAVDEAGVTALDLELAASALAGRQLHWDLSATIDHHLLLVNARRLQQAGIGGLGKLTLSTVSASGQTELNATVQHPDNLDILVDDIDDILPKLQLELTASTTMEQVNAPKWVRDLAGNFTSQLSLSQGSGSATVIPRDVSLVLPTELLALPVETLDWLRWSEHIDLNLKDGATVELEFDSAGNWNASVKDAGLLLGNERSDFRLSQMNLLLAGTFAEPDHYATTFTGRLDGKLQRTTLPQFKLQLDQIGKISNSTVDLSIQDTAQSMYLSIKGKGDLQSGNSDIETTLGSEDLAYASETLLPLLTSLSLLDKRLPIVLDSGRAQLESLFKTVNFELSGLPLSELEAEGVSGMYDDYRFSGLAIDTAWRGLDAPQTLRPIDIQLTALDVGFDLSDIQLLLSLPGTAANQPLLVNIDAFTSTAFGGSLFLPESGQWEMGRGSNQLTLRAEGWHLADLVALQQDQDIQARGTLEGQLPVTISDGRIMIANGYLRALAPGGSIRYIANESSVALAQSSKELALALDLLNDFQFEVLSTEVELDELGNLKLGLSLAGSNPSMFNGRAVNFNINLEQNLDPLLQSLRLSDKLVEQLEDRIN